MGRPRLRAWLPLLAVSTLPAVAESVVLRAVGFESAMGLAPQVSATAAFGVFHDLRWLMVYHRSWTGFVLEALAAVLVRSLLMAGIVHAAWPADVPRPRMRSTLWRSLTFTAVTMVFLSPWAAVAMAASETSLSWFFVGELLPVLFLGVALSRGGITQGWWRGLPTAGAVGWSVVSFAVLCIDAMVIGFTPGWWAVPVTGVAGAVNGLLWRRTVASVVRARPRTRWLPSVPVAYLLSASALAAMGQFSSLGTVAASRPIPRIAAAHSASIKETIVYVGGYDSAYRPATGHDTSSLVHFSYRGSRPSGKPLAYGPLRTHQSLATSAGRLAKQVTAVHRHTGRPVALVGQSEGTLVVVAYLAHHVHPHVEAAVLLSPLVRPGRIYYPPRGQEGWGVAAGWELRGMLTAVRITSGAHLSADEPFVRSVLNHAPLYRNRMLCPVRGVRMIAFVPTISAAVVPPGAVSHIPVIELPGLHASLLGRLNVEHRITTFLNGGRPGRAPGLYYPVIQKASSAWEAPALALALNPVWHAAGLPDTAFGQNGCSARS